MKNKKNKKSKKKEKKRKKRKKEKVIESQLEISETGKVCGFWGSLISHHGANPR
jgi:hypothetical protein